ncbi:hypothetical protein GCM10027359_20020 [Marilutibacter aestuarii]
MAARQSDSASRSQGSSFHMRLSAKPTAHSSTPAVATAKSIRVLGVRSTVMGVGYRGCAILSVVPGLPADFRGGATRSGAAG